MDKNTNADYRLLYELNMYQRKLDLEIAAAEHQLSSVQKRLTSLVHDLYMYLAFLIVPLLVCAVLNAFTAIPSASILFFVFSIVSRIIICAYIILLPANVYHTIKTIMYLRLNRERDIPVDLPLLEGVRKGDKVPQEPNFRSEHDKLLLVLSRYYLNQDTVKELYKQIQKPSCEMTLADLKAQLNKLPVYEDIQPANLYSGAMEKKAKKMTRYIVAAIIGAILLSVVIAVVL